jgi:putative cell wall-binding protein
MGWWLRRVCLGVAVVVMATVGGGSVVTGGQVASAGDEIGLARVAASDSGVVRVAGPDRFATAAALSARTFEPGVPVVYVATGETFADALAGGPAAAVSGGPVLLVARDRVPAATAAELQRLRPASIVVLGGGQAVAASVEAELAGFASAGVTRLAGRDRFATAAAVSRAVFDPGVGTVFVATGADYPDALAGGALAGKAGAPVLLVGATAVTAATETELARLRPDTIVVLGGTGVIGTQVTSRLQTLTDATVTRAAGPDRFGTAAAVANRFGDNPTTVYVATGQDYPDALAGVAAAVQDQAPILLVTRDAVPQATAAVLRTLQPDTIVILGGTAAISTTTQQALSSIKQMMPAYDPVPGCAEGSVVPLGQAPSAVGFEPLGSVWCFDLAEPPAGRTAVEGPNSWLDDFDFCESFPCHTMARFDDGDLGYRVFDAVGRNPGRSQHWLNQNHWMVDMKGAFQGGAMLRPDRSFRFQDGKLVVEADVAAAIPEYGDSGDTWVELTVTSSPAPTRTDPFPDALYAYGQFPGHWSVGCRLQASRVPVCAAYSPVGTPGDGLCQETGGRLFEISFWQHCGQSYGGGPFSTDDLQDYWRECDRNGMDMACRDRFRMEITKDSLSLYVNGKLYFRDSGWPASHQLPDSFLTGDVFVYQSNWQVRNGDDWADPDDGATYRYHWDRFAVNPSTPPSSAHSLN